jgi:predicted Fe-Mo cluster-binding NifX family protein
MKIAISITADAPDPEVDFRFGRARFYLIVDLEKSGSQTSDAADGGREIHANPAFDAVGGAGVRAARFLVEQGVEAVISGRFGPSAFDVLRASGIATYEFPNEDEIKVDNLIERFRSGQLTDVTGPTGAGMHGA